MWFAIGLVTLVVAGASLYLLGRRDYWTAPEIARGVRVGSVIDRSGSLREVTIGLDFLPGIEFECRREGGGSRLLKRLGVASELQVGDRRFDDDVYLVCDDPRLRSHLRDEPALVAAIHELVTTAPPGFRGGHLVCRGLSLRVHYCGDFGTKNGKELLDWARPLLETIRDALPRQSGVPRPRRDPLLMRAVALLSASGALAAWGLVQGMGLIALDEAIVVDRGEWLMIGLGGGAAMLAVLVGLTLRLLSGTSRLPVVLGPVLLGGTFGCLVGGLGLARDLNALFDTSVTVPMAAAVADLPRDTKPVARLKHEGAGHFVVYVGVALPEGGRVQISREAYERLAPGMPVVVNMRAGALGIRWVESITPARPAASPIPAH